jgi:hypothetical protein
MFKQFLVSFTVGLTVFSTIAIVAHTAHGYEITPKTQPDCSKVQCTKDGSELVPAKPDCKKVVCNEKGKEIPPQQCFQVLEFSTLCLGDAWYLPEKK